jgi:hypothetical protein
MIGPEGKMFDPIHPKVAAKLLKVHLRTIFRKIRGGHLISINGRVDRNVILTAIADMDRSCSKAEAKHLLGVGSPTTITSWRSRSILETIYVLGEPRVLLSSIEEVKAMPTFDPQQGYGKKLLPYGHKIGLSLGTIPGETRGPWKSAHTKVVSVEEEPLVLYVPNSAKERRAIAHKRLVTLESAARFLGMSSVNGVKLLMRDRALKSISIGGRALLYAQSVLAQKTCMTEGGQDRKSTQVIKRPTTSGGNTKSSWLEERHWYKQAYGR